MSKTRRIDFSSELEHCTICGCPLSEDELLYDEHDNCWCEKCHREFLQRVGKLVEQMRKEKRR